MNDTIETRWEQQNEAGRLSFTDGDFARAEQSFLAAIREATQLGADNVRLASSLSNLGQLKYKQKDFAQAEALFHRALAIRERVLGPEHFGLVQNINNLAALHYARGELNQAEPLFQRALGISEQHLGESHPDVAVTLNNLARLYFRQNEYASAGPLLARLLSIKEQALGASHPEIAAILTSLAKVRLHEQDFDGGEAFARRALEIREKLQLPNDLAVATALETLAEINGARGRIDLEIANRERALQVREGAMGADHPVVASARATIEARRATLAPALQPIVAQAPPSAAKPPVAKAPVAKAPDAPRPVAPPVAQPPVAARPSVIAPPPEFVISPPPARTTRTTSLPFIEVTEAPTFDRARPPSVPRNSGSNSTVAIPLRSGNGNGNGAHGATAPHTAESPLAFHPLTEAPQQSRYNVAPPAASAAIEIEPSLAPDAHAQSPFTNSFARLVAETPSGRNAIVQDSPPPPTTHRISEPRPEISLDWPIEPRRPWLKIIAGLIVVGAIAGGGWYFLSRYETTSAPVVAAPVAKAKPIVAAPTDTLAIKHDSAPPGPPASVVKPGVTTSIVPVSKPEAAPIKPEPTVMKPEAAVVKPVFVPTGPAKVASQDEGPPPQAKNATHTAAKADAAPTVAASDAESDASPSLPAAIKVDAITNMIDDSARHRADSVGSTIQQKPPTFKPKTYKPPA
ncbi:MAG: tetratricopeptide repeat protein [Gemmatimonadaceae bacterium]|nr:tetratricopeptide repeat protein [Gemmatimonadaceae bacterium]